MSSREDDARDDEEEKGKKKTKKKKTTTTTTTTVEEDDVLLDVLLSTWREDDASAFEKCVDENVDRLTTLFFDRLLVRIEKLREEEEEEEEKGKDAAEELEEVAERTLMAVESRATFERASEIEFPETITGYDSYARSDVEETAGRWWRCQ